MTNYNERLYKIIWKLCHDFENRKVDSLQAQVDAKAAITSLIKELVAEAKPGKKDQLAQSTSEDESRSRFYRYGGYNFAIEEFEQNLLKELEEV